MSGQYSGFMEAIGNTPLIRLNAASNATGCEIYGKAEFMNPGGSVKDRAARGMIEHAEKTGALKPGGTIIEGTAGNTGISLAMCGNARGYKTIIVMPETQSQEKKDMLRLLGADLRLVPAKPYKDPGNYVRYSEQLAIEMNDTLGGGVMWANQFDNIANQQGHYQYTAPEIWEQTSGRIDGFTCSVGSGGTIGGISRYLKEQNQDITIALSDPHGSALYHHYAHGELKSDGSSISEGIGQGRITANLGEAKIDTQYSIPDTEALPIIFDLLKDEGLLLGGSSAINVAGAIRLARDLGPGKTIVTILCDSGQRYQSKIWNPAFLKEKELPVPSWLEVA
ncbi:cysteine synthase A [Alphaproteobacteria bacterium]|jgi:cysteine synthase A|nr:cysteine synthase A [Alphaproteobacteria bacterium]